MPNKRPLMSLEDQIRSIGGNLRREIVGGVIAVVGALMLFSLLAHNPNTNEPLPLLTVLTGWIAPLFALSVIVLGLVVAFHPRAGYWSAEALVGAELLLLGLAVGTFVANNSRVTWRVRLDGEDGGLVGWALGSLTMAATGRWIAMLLVILLVGAGVVLLVRYTPLVYAAAAVGRRLPGMGELAANPPWRRRSRANRYPPLPHTPNFVTPGQASTTATRSTPAAYVAPVAAAASTKAPRHPSQAPAPAPPATAAKAAKPAKSVPAPAPAPPRPARPNSALPPHDLLLADGGSYGNANVTLMEQMILKTLEDFNVPARVVHVESGPTVTQFGIEPLYVERAGQKRKVRVNRIVSLADDLALALAAPAVRIEAPVPGRPYVGIEVPNPDKSLVSLRGIIDSAEMRKGGELALPLGRNTAGAAVVMDLTKAPHLLIAGATGSGKSVCINTVVAGLLMQHGPDSLRFVMVDPKMVELPGYNGIPHLYGKVITNVEQVMGALTWLLLQMDDRYQLFRAAGVRNIDAYNALVRKQKSAPPLPYILLVVDELADLMMTAAEDVERQICRLAQMARATGIHLIIATQRPSVDVITGLIKANFPTRIAFSVTSQIDSRVVLDTPGAERLLGRGDMLLMRPDAGKLTRLQGCFVSDEEISRIVAFWKGQAVEGGSVVPPWNALMEHLGDEEELVQDAIEVLSGLKSCSTSMLQRRLGLGYPKAARLMETLEKRKIVGPDQGAGRGRDVLIKGEAEADESDEDNEPE
jgi:DNA segregation ATPase FtsK/SpoIIIE, S-DNA-T family